jgi:hypothetical protein
MGGEISQSAMGFVANLLNALVVPGYWVPAVKIEREESTMTHLRQSLPVNLAAFKREGGSSAMTKLEVPSMRRRIKRQRTEDTHE